MKVACITNPILAFLFFNSIRVVLYEYPEYRCCPGLICVPPRGWGGLVRTLSCMASLFLLYPSLLVMCSPSNDPN